MSTPISARSFNWDAYETNLLKNHKLSYYKTPALIYSITTTLLITAGTLAAYAIRAKLSVTPCILTCGTAVAITLLAVALLYKSRACVHIKNLVLRRKNFLAEKATNQIGLKEILANPTTKELCISRKLIWVNISNYELTLGFKEIILRNGDIRDLLTTDEKQTLCVQQLNKIKFDDLNAKGIVETIEIAEALGVLNELAQLTPFKNKVLAIVESNECLPLDRVLLLASRTAFNNEMPKDLDPTYPAFISQLSSNQLIPSTALALIQELKKWLSGQIQSLADVVKELSAKSINEEASLKSEYYKIREKRLSLYEDKSTPLQTELKELEERKQTIETSEQKDNQQADLDLLNKAIEDKKRCILELIVTYVNGGNEVQIEEAEKLETLLQPYLNRRDAQEAEAKKNIDAKYAEFKKHMRNAMGLPE